MSYTIEITGVSSGVFYDDKLVDPAYLGSRYLDYIIVGCVCQKRISTTVFTEWQFHQALTFTAVHPKLDSTVQCSDNSIVDFFGKPDQLNSHALVLKRLSERNSWEKGNRPLLCESPIFVEESNENYNSYKNIVGYI